MCATLPSAETSLCCGEAGKKEKESARGTMGRGKGEGEERPLSYNVRFTGRICGSVVLAKPADYLGAYEDCFKDDAFSFFPSSPARFSFFFYYCYFYRDIQREPRRRREWPGCFKSMLAYVIFHPKNTKNPSCVGTRCALW